MSKFIVVKLSQISNFPLVVIMVIASVGRDDDRFPRFALIISSRVHRVRDKYSETICKVTSKCWIVVIDPCDQNSRIFPM